MMRPMIYDRQRRAAEDDELPAAVSCVRPPSLLPPLRCVWSIHGCCGPQGASGAPPSSRTMNSSEPHGPPPSSPVPIRGGAGFGKKKKAGEKEEEEESLSPSSSRRATAKTSTATNRGALARAAVPHALPAPSVVGVRRSPRQRGQHGAWILVLCLMSILFAALSGRQLPSIRIMTSTPEDSYRHLYTYQPTPTGGADATGSWYGGGETGTGGVTIDRAGRSADDMIDDDDDDDDSVDREGFFVGGQDEREDNFQIGLWDDEQEPLPATEEVVESGSAKEEPSNGGGGDGGGDDPEVDYEADGPWVAQLLSYPNSGTSYTLMNTWSLANKSTATSHGQEAYPGTRLALRPTSGYKAPYVVRPDLLPSTRGLVLSKSHCEGFCFTCPPASQLTEAFELRCRTAAYRSDGTYHRDAYGMDIVKKFVHLIRDPLDNCVSRMHHGIKTMDPDDRVSEIRTALADNPVSGLDKWCAHLDDLFRPNIPGWLASRPDADEILNVPCHAEFVRYVAWHNAAYQMTRVKYASLPVYRLYYENYTSNYEGVVRELYEEFLRYPPIHSAPRPFVAGKSYHHLFSPQHQLDIKRLVRSLALPPVWDLLQHYFADLRTFNYTHDGRKRSIALLVSFPNSGTSYTINNVQNMNAASAGTNYGGEIKGNVIIPIFPELPNGPWVLRPYANETLPDVVLTKSHCTGYCDNCMKFVVPLDVFETGCHETFHHELQQHFSYTDAGVVDRAVHLFRSPFDNLVSRKHLGVQSRLSSDPSFAKMVGDSREAILSWCNYTDQIIIGNPQASGWSRFNPEWRAMFESVPCSVEMFRHVQWHNLAIEMTSRRRIPVHYVYYEDYETKFNETVDNLMQFLELEVRNVSEAFEVGKAYDSIFDHEQSVAIAKFVRTVATPDCWRHLAHYFDRWLKYDQPPNPDPPSLAGASNVLEPSVVWLLSFPNSGTTYTMDNVEWMSYQSVASNYKREGTVPVHAARPEGPFIHNMSLGLPPYVLTKTHCDGYCDDCGMIRSYMNFSNFEAGCGRSERIWVNGVISNPPYPSSVPVKVVHLIRSPWDNIVSRMHHGIFRRRTYLNWTEEQLSPFQTSRQGVMAWCQYADRRFWDARALNVSGLSVDDLQAITSVPCGPDFFRYVQWHNNAVALIRKMGVPAHRIYYEDYTLKFNRTTQDLLDFLGLRAVNPPLYFKTGKTYETLMDTRDRRKAWELIQRLASPELRPVLRRYESSVDLATDLVDKESSRRFLRRH